MDTPMETERRAHGGQQEVHSLTSSFAPDMSTIVDMTEQYTGSFDLWGFGSGFDFENLPDPTAPENIEKENGRGIFLIKNQLRHLTLERQSISTYHQAENSVKSCRDTNTTSHIVSDSNRRQSGSYSSSFPARTSSRRFFRIPRIKRSSPKKVIRIKVKS